MLSPVDPSPRATEFLASYLSAFERLDPAEIAGRFAFPFHMTSDGDPPDLTAVPDAAAWEAQIAQLVGFYRDVGVVSARILEASATVLSPRVEQVAVHWELHDGSGGRLYDFHAVYTLTEVDGSFRIAALAHDELVRVGEFLAQR